MAIDFKLQILTEENGDIVWSRIFNEGKTLYITNDECEVAIYHLQRMQERLLDIIEKNNLKWEKEQINK